MNSETNLTLDGPTFTFIGVRLTALTVKSFLRTLDLGITFLGIWRDYLDKTTMAGCNDRSCSCRHALL